MKAVIRLLKGAARDKRSATAALSCLIPLIGMFAHARWEAASQASAAENAIALLVFLAALPLAALMMAWPQFTMWFLLGNLRSTFAKSIGAAASLALSVWYALWAGNADLTGSSTAPVALILYPIMIQGWLWAAAFIVVLVVAKLDTEDGQ
jgi:hypothetical protein